VGARRVARVDTTSPPQVVRSGRIVRVVLFRLRVTFSRARDERLAVRRAVPIECELDERHCIGVGPLALGASA
jgi:hypothetical protein